jgi:putative DNA methylase
MTLTPFEWADRPSLIEHLFPVRKLSAESFKEQMAGAGKTLTALGSYWKGRKPLILNKACVLGALLPATGDHMKDLEIFEMLMGMDKESLKYRLAVKNDKQSRFFLAREETVRDEEPYSEWVRAACRPEECGDELFDHIWDRVNEHLGTSARSFPELIEQMGIARFGRRPRVADVFCGSGQIPFEAARLGCDVYASDLNPIACMLTWGAFHIVGAREEERALIDAQQRELAGKVQEEIDALGVETDGKGWRAKAFLYCVEVKCPETGWMVPLIPSLIISQPRTGEKNNVVAELIPVPAEKRYDIRIRSRVRENDLPKYKKGTVVNGEMLHSPDGVTVYRKKISALRGDYKEDGESKNRLRMWEKEDFIPRPDDIFQERLYCVQWTRKKPKKKTYEYEFRSVTPDDLAREQKVIEYVGAHLAEWQEKGYIPDTLIEPGEKTDEPIRTRGWTHWHHLFNSRQLMVAGVARNNATALLAIPLIQSLNWNSKLSHWSPLDGGGGSVKQTFYNQALNTFYNYGTRSSEYLKGLYCVSFFSFPFTNNISVEVHSHSVEEIKKVNDIYITDPPYGDAVMYDEITEFFIAWLRKNPPPEFAGWTWDSRRALAIKGSGEDFRSGMVTALRTMAANMPENGLQLLMFTHRSGSIWADMANIIWASGLRVTAAWYVATETDSALRQGANVTGTILLVLRKRGAGLEGFRDELGWEIESAVKEQIHTLSGLNTSLQEQNPEGFCGESDMQIAGYAAALKVLTSYSTIDGKDMEREARAPRVEGRADFVGELIEFASRTANQTLVPSGFEELEWQRLDAVERFYLKMADMEYQGEKALSNYQNFAKAFKVRHFEQLMSDYSKSNAARLKLAPEFRASQMSGDAELAGTTLRALLYAMLEVTGNAEIEDVLLHMMDNCPDYLRKKPTLLRMARYLAEKRGALKPTKNYHPDKDASAARILAEALENQRL